MGNSRAIENRYYLIADFLIKLTLFIYFIKKQKYPSMASFNYYVAVPKEQDLVHPDRLCPFP